jgi:signal transduction histidine kinase
MRGIQEGTVACRNLVGRRLARWLCRITVGLVAALAVPAFSQAHSGVSPASQQTIAPCATAPDSVLVRTRTPFYETWYFYLAALFVGILLPAHLFRRHLMKLKGDIGIVLEERNRIARECHDTLMAGFAAISWQLEATAKLFRDSGLETTDAASSCELARSMVVHCQSEARRIIWDLRETDEITNILSQALARLLAATQVQRTIDTTLEVEGDEVPLAPGCVHHLVCISQEAVTNAIRHASPSRILVRLHYDSDALLLSIRDDGHGYQPPPRASSRHGHFGIAVMQERTRKVGGEFKIQKAPGSGTEVSVHLRFNSLQQPANQGQHVIRWIGI